VGISFKEVPSAPGAPLGQSGTGGWISERAKAREPKRRAKAKAVFIKMVR